MTGWSGKSRQPKNIVDFFRQSPLVGLELDLKRDRSPGATSIYRRMIYERVSTGYELHL